MKHIAFAVIFASLLGVTSAHAGELWRAKGFKTPESVLYDSAHKRLIVSNMDGAPNKADGNGYLSLMSPDGKVTVEKWATGMDAPKGMAIADKHLYVSDITQLRIIDVETGKVVNSVPMEGSVFLNDVTASPEGDVYISDMLTNTIYRYHDGKPEVWLKDENLNSPNGVLFAGDHLIVGTWGKGMKKDFTTETPGGLITVNLKTKAITPVPHAESFGNIDGVVKAGDAIIVTDYIAGLVWRCPSGAAPEKFATLKPGNADLGTDGTNLFIPLMKEGEVVALPVK